MKIAPVSILSRHYLDRIISTDRRPVRQLRTLSQTTLKSGPIQVKRDRSQMFSSGGKAFSAFRPPALDDIAARLGGHPFQKPMGPSTLDLARLIRSFHNLILFILLIS